ncbi:MAG: peptidase associated/transthyretin-like domain-containing protein [Planctomycetota bacterium]|jgi:hypothetical protein
MNRRVIGTIIGTMILALPGWAEETGFIQIKCAPGVQLFLDGNLKGVTNEDVGGLIIQNVKPGRHEVKAVKPKFQPQVSTVTVNAGKIDVDGRTLYHMVTGRVPFYHEDKRNIMNMHLHTSLTPPDHINRKLSIGISEMIEIMMKKNPEDRYQNIKILIEDIESILGGNPPIRAHQSIDVGRFSPLASGDFVPPEMSALEYEIIIRRQRTALIVCVVSSVLVILILILFLTLRL